MLMQEKSISDSVECASSHHVRPKRICKRQTPWLKVVPESFCSKAFYQDVAENWRGLGARFLFITVPVVTLSMGLTLLTLYLSELEPLEAVASKLPEIKVVNGKLVRPSRLTVVEGESAKRILVVDPQATYTGDTKFLITETRFNFPASVRPIKLSMFKPNWTVTGAELVTVLRQILFATITVMMIVCFLLEGPVRLVGAAAGAAVGKLLRSRRSFSQMMRLLLAISVPTSILAFPIQYVGLKLGVSSGVTNQLCTLVWVFYAVFAFNATQQPKQPQHSDSN